MPEFNPTNESVTWTDYRDWWHWVTVNREDLSTLSKSSVYSSDLNVQGCIANIIAYQQSEFATLYGDPDADAIAKCTCLFSHWQNKLHLEYIGDRPPSLESFILCSPMTKEVIRDLLNRQTILFPNPYSPSTLCWGISNPDIVPPFLCVTVTGGGPVPTTTSTSTTSTSTTTTQLPPIDDCISAPFCNELVITDPDSLLHGGIFHNITDLLSVDAGSIPHTSNGRAYWEFTAPAISPRTGTDDYQIHYSPDYDANVNQDAWAIWRVGSAFQEYVDRETDYNPWPAHCPATPAGRVWPSGIIMNWGSC